MPQHVFMDSGGSVVLISENEKYIRLEIRDSQVFQCKHANLQQILQLSRNLALVVDKNKLRAGHC
jgi:hypothetical protein